MLNMYKMKRLSQTKFKKKTTGLNIDPNQTYGQINFQKIQIHKSDI